MELLEQELAEERARSKRLEQALVEFQREEEQSLLVQANRHRQQLVDQANVHRMIMKRQADKYMEGAMRQADRHREAATHLIEQRRQAMERLIGGYRVQSLMRLSRQPQADGAPKKKRGRPRKTVAPSVPIEQQASTPAVNASSDHSAESVQPKKRGRPPKQKQKYLPRPPVVQHSAVPLPDGAGQNQESALAENEYFKSFNKWLENRQETQWKQTASTSAAAPVFSTNSSTSYDTTDQVVNDRVTEALAITDAHNRRRAASPSVDAMASQHSAVEGRPKLKTRRTSEKRVYIPYASASSDSSSNGPPSKRWTGAERFKCEEDED